MFIDTIGVLISGAPQSGKSSLCSELINRGGRLIADDRTELYMDNGMLMARSPDAIASLIELYGVGVVQLPDRHVQSCAPVHLEIYLKPEPIQRLPDVQATVTYVGIDIPIIYQPARDPYVASRIQLLTSIMKENGELNTVTVAMPGESD